MTPQKLDVVVAMLCYGSNGGAPMQLPEITTWFAKNFLEMKQDDRIGRIAAKRYGDIPLSMERNRIVKDAKQGGFDAILMLDSDNVPDLYLGHKPWAKPFWKTSFDMLYERALQALPTVICAPYCGPPPHPVSGGEENVYVFHAEFKQRYRPTSNSRPIREITPHKCVASRNAGPTGVILY